jgi:hypothetical protein
VHELDCIASYTVYSYLETALHVSGGISTHHQERIQLYVRYLIIIIIIIIIFINCNWVVTRWQWLLYI